MDDLIKVTAGLVAVAAVIVLFVYGAVFLGIPIVIGYLLWRFWLQDHWRSQKNAAWQRRETRETKELYERVQKAFRASDLAREDAREEMVNTIAFAALDQVDREPVGAVNAAVVGAAEALVAESDIFNLRTVDTVALPPEQGVELRQYLRRKLNLLSDTKRTLDACHWLGSSVLGGVLAALPADAVPKEDEEETANTFSVALVDLLEDPAKAIERTIMTVIADEVEQAGIFDALRERVELNALRASGIDPAERATTRKSTVLPTQAKGQSPSELVDAYLSGTPFEAFFRHKFGIKIPFPVRFEHCHVVGGTGHGKTQLLQTLIHHDLLAAREGKGSLVVIDSQGDLIRKITHLAYFSPTADKSLADKLLLVDPNDIAHPVGLNMFDVNMKRINSYAPVEREKILNGTIELYEYIFGALLGAELTQKQGVIFKYLARLMLVIPNATVQTLRELMEDGEPFRPYIDKLEGTPRKFFETQFFDRSFDDTKKQILRRLWGVLSNSTFERMFSNPRNKVDMFDAMNSGKIILINTAKDLLKQEGCEIFGRFFIAMIAQAAMQRAAIPEDRRKATFVYIDEAQDYFDDSIEDFLNQARKYRVGLIIAHQNLDQLSPKLRASIMASTSIKLAGGVSAKDASAFAKEMRCTPEYIQAMRKRPAETEFACWIKNTTPHAIKLSVPLGSFERLPTISEGEYAALIEENRRHYCVPADGSSPAPETSTQRQAQEAFKLSEHEVL